MGRAITRKLWIFFISLTLLTAGCGRVNAPSALDAVVSELAPTATPTNAPEPTPAESLVTPEPEPEPEMGSPTLTPITPIVDADGRVLFSPYYLELPAGRAMFILLGVRFTIHAGPLSPRDGTR